MSDFPDTGGEHAERVAPGEDRVDELALPGAERRKSKDLAEDLGGVRDHARRRLPGYRGTAAATGAGRTRRAASGVKSWGLSRRRFFSAATVVSIRARSSSSPLGGSRQEARREATSGSCFIGGAR